MSVFRQGTTAKPASGREPRSPRRSRSPLRSPAAGRAAKAQEIGAADEAGRADGAGGPRAGNAASVHRALSRAAFYPRRPSRVEVRETHISWVFLAGDRAYKLKKPLVLPFLDYGTPRRRREMCRAEVRLGRRLAPGVYLGVRAVAMRGGKVALVGEEGPGAIDYVVEMCRYDEGSTLAARLARGELERAEMTGLGQALARFHDRAPEVPPARGDARAVRGRVGGNVRELLGLLEQAGEVERVLALERFAHAFATAHAPVLDRRAREGRLRECHGDVRAEHVLLEGDPRVVDCIEFDRAHRELDVADELAFLCMDLEHRGGRRFARAFVRAYREAGGDPGEDPLIAFYAAHRALVRAKVALLRARQLPATAAERGHQGALARDLIALAERFAWRARAPLVLVVCGVPASGKSYLGRALGTASGLRRISSDVVRKRLAGVPPGERAPAATYSAWWNRRTYAALGRRAADEARARGGVIVDASFRHRADRDELARALGAAARPVFIECRAPAAVLDQRARRRDRRRRGVSDATLEVVVRERQAWDPLDEVPAAAHLPLRTDRPAAEQVADVIALLDRRLTLFA